MSCNVLSCVIFFCQGSFWISGSRWTSQLEQHQGFVICLVKTEPLVLSGMCFLAVISYVHTPSILHPSFHPSSVPASSWAKGHGGLLEPTPAVIDTPWTSHKFIARPSYEIFFLERKKCFFEIEEWITLQLTIHWKHEMSLCASCFQE